MKIEWAKAEPFLKKNFDCIEIWNGKGANFDFKIYQYERGFVVFIRLPIKTRSDGFRALKEKRIGQFKTAEEAQECAVLFDNTYLPN